MATTPICSPSESINLTSLHVISSFKRVSLSVAILYSSKNNLAAAHDLIIEALCELF